MSFIRGFYLFQLAKEFKDVPLRLTASQSPSTFPLAKSSQEEVWAQAIQDLTEAANLLPLKMRLWENLPREQPWQHWVRFIFMRRNTIKPLMCWSR